MPSRPPEKPTGADKKTIYYPATPQPAATPLSAFIKRYDEMEIGSSTTYFSSLVVKLEEVMSEQTAQRLHDEEAQMDTEKTDEEKKRARLDAAVAIQDEEREAFYRKRGGALVSGSATPSRNGMSKSRSISGRGQSKGKEPAAEIDIEKRSTIAAGDVHQFVPHEVEEMKDGGKGKQPVDKDGAAKQYAQFQVRASKLATHMATIAIQDSTNFPPRHADLPWRLRGRLVFSGIVPNVPYRVMDAQDFYDFLDALTGPKPLFNAKTCRPDMDEEQKGVVRSELSKDWKEEYVEVLEKREHDYDEDDAQDPDDNGYGKASQWMRENGTLTGEYALAQARGRAGLTQCLHADGREHWLWSEQVKEVWDAEKAATLALKGKKKAKQLAICSFYPANDPVSHTATFNAQTCRVENIVMYQRDRYMECVHPDDTTYLMAKSMMEEIEAEKGRREKEDGSLDRYWEEGDKAAKEARLESKGKAAALSSGLPAGAVNIESVFGIPDPDGLYRFERPTGRIGDLIEMAAGRSLPDDQKGHMSSGYGDMAEQIGHMIRQGLDEREPKDKGKGKVPASSSYIDQLAGASPLRCRVGSDDLFDSSTCNPPNSARFKMPMTECVHDDGQSHWLSVSQMNQICEQRLIQKAMKFSLEGKRKASSDDSGAGPAPRASPETSTKRKRTTNKAAPRKSAGCQTNLELSMFSTVIRLDQHKLFGVPNEEKLVAMADIQRAAATSNIYELGGDHSLTDPLVCNPVISASWQKEIERKLVGETAMADKPEPEIDIEFDVMKAFGQMADEKVQKWMRRKSRMTGCRHEAGKIHWLLPQEVVHIQKVKKSQKLAGAACKSKDAVVNQSDDGIVYCRGDHSLFNGLTCYPVVSLPWLVEIEKEVARVNALQAKGLPIWDKDWYARLSALASEGDKSDEAFTDTMRKAMRMTVCRHEDGREHWLTPREVRKNQTLKDFQEAIGQQQVSKSLSHDLASITDLLEISALGARDFANIGVSPEHREDMGHLLAEFEMAKQNPEAEKTFWKNRAHVRDLAKNATPESLDEMGREYGMKSVYKADSTRKWMPIKEGTGFEYGPQIGTATDVILGIMSSMGGISVSLHKSQAPSGFPQQVWDQFRNVVAQSKEDLAVCRDLLTKWLAKEEAQPRDTNLSGVQAAMSSQVDDSKESLSALDSKLVTVPNLDGWTLETIAEFASELALLPAKCISTLTASDEDKGLFEDLRAAAIQAQDDDGRDSKVVFTHKLADTNAMLRSITLGVFIQTMRDLGLSSYQEGDLCNTMAESPVRPALEVKDVMVYLANVAAQAVCMGPETVKALGESFASVASVIEKFDGYTLKLCTHLKAKPEKFQDTVEALTTSQAAPQQERPSTHARTAMNKIIASAIKTQQRADPTEKEIYAAQVVRIKEQLAGTTPAQLEHNAGSTGSNALIEVEVDGKRLVYSDPAHSILGTKFLSTSPTSFNIFEHVPGLRDKCASFVEDTLAAENDPAAEGAFQKKYAFLHDEINKLPLEKRMKVAMNTGHYTATDNHGQRVWLPIDEEFKTDYAKGLWDRCAAATKRLSSQVPAKENTGFMSQPPANSKPDSADALPPITIELIHQLAKHAQNGFADLDAPDGFKKAMKNMGAMAIELTQRDNPHELEVFEQNYACFAPLLEGLVFGKPLTNAAKQIMMHTVQKRNQIAEAEEKRKAAKTAARANRKPRPKNKEDDKILSTMLSQMFGLPVDTSKALPPGLDEGFLDRMYGSIDLLKKDPKTYGRKVKEDYGDWGQDMTEEDITEQTRRALMVGPLIDGLPNLINHKDKARWEAERAKNAEKYKNAKEIEDLAAAFESLPPETLRRKTFKPTIQGECRHGHDLKATPCNRAHKTGEICSGLLGSTSNEPFTPTPRPESTITDAQAKVKAQAASIRALEQSKTFLEQTHKEALTHIRADVAKKDTELKRLENKASEADAKATKAQKEKEEHASDVNHYSAENRKLKTERALVRVRVEAAEREVAERDQEIRRLEDEAEADREAEAERKREWNERYDKMWERGMRWMRSMERTERKDEK